MSLPAAPPDGRTPPLDGLEGDQAWEDQRWPAQAPNDKATGLPDSLSWAEDAPRSPNLKARRRETLARPVERPAMPLSPQQKLLLLDTWQRSGLPARDFGALVNISRQTLYAWKRRFQELGPAGLMDQPKGVKKGSQLLPTSTSRQCIVHITRE
ncbi:MAG: helix-turn-helix domain-containing protein [Planctomycetaceae bacterium]|nr:helix-turn-helix domain-containing protein [Planctomycetaceae bacterium]